MGRTQRRTIVLAALSALSAISTALAVLFPEWIEALGVDPDHGSGLFEWGIPLALGALTILLAVGAHRVRAGRPVVRTS